MSYKEVKIGSIAKFINGYPFKPTDRTTEGYKIIRIQNLTDKNTLFNLTNKKIPEKFIVRNGDILVSWSATIDVFEWDQENAYLNQHIFKIDYDSSKVDKIYFKYALLRTINELIQYAQGSTLKHIVKNDFENHKIPLPPLSEQVKIGAILSKLDFLIDNKATILNLIGDLQKSQFSEMFMASKSNLKLSKPVGLGTFCDFENGDRSSNYPSGNDIKDKGVLFISSSDIVNFKFQLRKSQFISKAKFDSLTRGKCVSGDVLMTLRGNGVGKCCVFDSVHKYGFINAQMVILRPNKNCLGRFLVEHIRNDSTFNRLINLTSGSAQPQITAASLKEFKIILPPIAQQKKFIHFIEVTDSLKMQIVESKDHLKELYDSIMQKAFSGEYKLSEKKNLDKLLFASVFTPGDKSQDFSREELEDHINLMKENEPLVETIRIQLKEFIKNNFSNQSFDFEKLYTSLKSSLETNEGLALYEWLSDYLSEEIMKDNIIQKFDLTKNKEKMTFSIAE